MCTMAQTALGFKIHGDWFTDHVRQLWAENKFAKAMDALDCLIGITLDDKRAILIREKKLVGVNELELVPDGAGVDPSIFDKVWVASEKDQIVQELLHKEARELARRWGEIYDCDPTGDGAQDRKEILKMIDDLVGEEERCELIREQIEIRDAKFDLRELRTQTCNSGSNDFAKTVGKILASKVDEAVPETRQEPDGYTTLPPSASDMSSKMGWLSPMGVYFPCSWMEHWNTADNLCQVMGIRRHVTGMYDPERILEESKWVKITGRTRSGDTSFFYEGKLTQKQRNKLFDYCELHGVDYKQQVEDNN